MAVVGVYSSTSTIIREAVADLAVNLAIVSTALSNRVLVRDRLESLAVTLICVCLRVAVDARQVTPICVCGAIAALAPVELRADTMIAVLVSTDDLDSVDISTLY